MLTNEWHAAMGDVSVRGIAVHHLLRPGSAISVAGARRVRDEAHKP